MATNDEASEHSSENSHKDDDDELTREDGTENENELGNRGSMPQVNSPWINIPSDAVFASAFGGDFQRYIATLFPALKAGGLLKSLDLQGLIPSQGIISKALSRPTDFVNPDPQRSAYSEQLESAASYFEPTEVEISSFDDLHTAITTLISKTPELPLVWRGARDARWGLHSHLFRHLMAVNGVEPPSRKPRESQLYPDEDQMVEAEREILRIARSDWRFDDMSALELFARIQHAGGPTRLIDVTKNPYIAAWFAVEADTHTDDKDARLFALATRPVPKTSELPAGESSVQLDDVGGLRMPFWHLFPTTPDRQQADWGTGARRRIWVPPAYDPRIMAQNAAFIFDGVPITSPKTAPHFTTGERNVYWRRADLLASASIYIRMSKPTKKPRYNAPNFAPSFSFRIEASAKQEIRHYLESRFGYRYSYVYPDVSALAAHLKTLPLNPN